MTTDLQDFIHISEREPDGSWEDCTWDSGLEWYRLCYDAGVPATHTEAQLLRKASGEPPTGGSNLGNLADGIRRRYGKVIPARISGYSNLKAALTRNKAAVIQGSMKAFGPGHRLSKWQRNFDGSHAVLLINDNGVLRWCDPEAPKGEPSVPVVVTWDEVKAFVTAFAGQHVVAPIKHPVTAQPTPPKEAAMPALTKYLPGYTANIKPESNLRSLPVISTATKVRTTGKAKEPVGIVGTVEGDKDPANNSTVWYELVDAKGARLYTAKDNVLDLKAPAGGTPTDCKPLIDAATAPLKATIAEQAATIASQKTALAEAAAVRARSVAAIDALKG